MLKYNYSLNASSNIQEIKLDDMYVSPGLTFVSGTTEETNTCSPGDTVWVLSPYFPSELSTTVTSRVLVKRNGYVITPLTLQVHSAKTVVGFDNEGNAVFAEMKYIEYNGNTYYASLEDGTFIIDNNTYTPDDSFVTIQAKLYIENDKITVNGITYNTFINNNNELVLTDSNGEVYAYGIDLDTSNVSYSNTWVEKISIGNNTKIDIECNGIGFYGHRGYVIYDGEKYYIEYFYDLNGDIIGAGVVINGIRYPYMDFYEQYNIYNILDYIKNDTGNPVIEIGGDEYIINFEPSQIEGSGIIYIDTVINNLPIMFNDRITIKSLNNNSEVRVNRDDDNFRYIYLNGRRYDSINHLCDTIFLGEREFQLTYEGDCTVATVNTIAQCTMTDGSIMYFKVTAIDENGHSEAKKVELIDGEWKDVYSFVKNGNEVVYSGGTSFDIYRHDGFLVNGQKMPISEKTIERWDNGDVTIIETYEYIVVGCNLEYGLKVINTIGSNRILCVPDIDRSVYGTSAVNMLSSEILSSIIGNSFIIQRRRNVFGDTDLYYDTWMSNAYQQGGGVSAYELADVYNNIKIRKLASHFTIPLTLQKKVCNKIEYEDLITSQYYDEEAEKAINKLVDMEKDMYTPVMISSNGTITDPLSIVFNMHFRTRDLETWKINEDEGTYVATSGDTEQETNLSANYQYCNYFITDYYPYYAYCRRNGYSSTMFGSLVDKSDLLGYMYFTTDDVKNKRQKLSRSFLRLTFFDSKNPENQNMLGTSTLYFDCDKYLNLLNSYEKKYHYEECAASRSLYRVPLTENYCDTDSNIGTKTIDMIGFRLYDGAVLKVRFKYHTTVESSLRIIVENDGSTSYTKDIYKNGTRVGLSNSWEDGEAVYMEYRNNRFEVFDAQTSDKQLYTLNEPTVLSEAFYGGQENRVMDNAVSHLVLHNDSTLNSKITLGDRYNTEYPSEGFYAYILKEFAKINGLKTPEENEATIYMKAEFFHAGLGIKIPMIIPTKKIIGDEGDVSYSAIPNSGWDYDTYSEFLKGYDLEDVFERLYVPIRIKYSMEQKRFVYSVSYDENYADTIYRGGNSMVFNLFELKIQP